MSSDFVTLPYKNFITGKIEDRPNALQKVGTAMVRQTGAAINFVQNDFGSGEMRILLNCMRVGAAAGTVAGIAFGISEGIESTSTPIFIRVLPVVSNGCYGFAIGALLSFPMTAAAGLSPNAYGVIGDAIKLTGDVFSAATRPRETNQSAPKPPDDPS
jgi:hypothetical protein